MLSANRVSRQIVKLYAPLRKWAGTSAHSNFVVLKDSSELKGIVDSADSSVLYFTASWCPPCKTIAPIFQKMAGEFPNTKFIKIDIDDHSDEAANFKIRSVPTFLFYKGASLKHQFSGAVEEQLRKYVTTIQN
mmetsp:Transcript_31391/g.23318  ORF Transcript_31391/g.23318 Transcript_31391/m.23318 type:complete len:133 (+) Transcript_31391:49-447(+)